MQLVDVNGLPMEIDESRITEVHGAAVCGAAFNETSQLLCTCGDDCTLHVRDFCNAVVHRFVLNQPILSCAFDGLSGDLLITQGAYILAVPEATYLPPRARELLRVTTKGCARARARALAARRRVGREARSRKSSGSLARSQVRQRRVQDAVRPRLRRRRARRRAAPAV